MHLERLQRSEDVGNILRLLAVFLIAVQLLLLAHLIRLVFYFLILLRFVEVCVHLFARPCRYFAIVYIFGNFLIVSRRILIIIYIHFIIIFSGSSLVLGHRLTIWLVDGDVGGEHLLRTAV